MCIYIYNCIKEFLKEMGDAIANIEEEKFDDAIEILTMAY